VYIYIHTTLRRIHVTIVPWQSNAYYEYVSVVLTNQHAMCICHIMTSVACPAVQYFSTLSQKRRDFQKKVIEYKMYVLIVSTTFV
jgi:hypothetical protein